MRKGFIKRISLYAVACALALTVACGAELSTFSASAAGVSCFSDTDGKGSPRAIPCVSLSVGARSGRAPDGSRYKGTKLYVGGIPFGVKFMTEGVLVTGFAEISTAEGVRTPARDAGLKVGDVILRAHGERIGSSSDLSRAVDRCGGKSIEIVYMRDGRECRTALTPVYSGDEAAYKSGIYVRDSGAGIGTVTYIMPETLEFGGLGHGICDGDTGKLIPMQRGSVVGVTINGVVKGIVGTPGEVKGYFSSGKTGSLFKNTDCGVFGAYASLPKICDSTLYEVGLRGEVKNGKAHIICTLDESGAQTYEVEISEIRLSSASNKCFNVKVTDPNLIAKTGGIVQGMSGSPIIQNGKLIGAVTHVLINDPTMGYGIFIENMLSSAQMPQARAA